MLFVVPISFFMGSNLPLQTSHHINNLKVFKIQGDEGELNGSSFHLDVPKLFVSCSIPLNVLDHPHFSELIENIMKKLLQVDESLTNCLGKYVKEV
uniref:Uncharacterized protein n=1 Tax=Lepeophtheirus salmonis TaxID=72036 RepID=A0A0K2VER4_LEPSM